MQAVEIRRDWFTGRVSVIAAARSKRPKLVKSPPSTPRKTCPFCRGNERMTPPAEMVAVLAPEGIKLKFGEDASNAHKWDVRVFPNMFPAVSNSTPPGNPSAYGYHLIVVETPDHTRDLDQLDIRQIETYLKVLLFEVKKLGADRRIRCISIFKNYGEDAGASIPHPHTQIIASQMVPPKVAAELRAFRNLGRSSGKSAISVLSQEARNEGRLVLNKGGYVAFVPYAPMEPFELWIAPTKVSRSITEGGPHIRQLAGILKTLLSAVKTIHGEVAYNLYFHLPPKRAERFHWHMEILPRTSKLAGYELGFGAYIITVPPEDAARLYRQVLMT
jgi:UDPglucose--hexose-1-phosphate uridylyltransferase